MRDLLPFHPGKIAEKVRWGGGDAVQVQVVKPVTQLQDTTNQFLPVACLWDRFLGNAAAVSCSHPWDLFCIGSTVESGIYSVRIAVRYLGCPTGSMPLLVFVWRTDHAVRTLESNMRGGAIRPWAALSKFKA